MTIKKGFWDYVPGVGAVTYIVKLAKTPVDSIGESFEQLEALGNHSMYQSLVTAGVVVGGLIAYLNK
jgi:hypothetical protein